MIKSEYATLRIPELDLEVPSSKKGYLNTIEGFLNNFYDELAENQTERKVIKKLLIIYFFIGRKLMLRWQKNSTNS